MENVGVEGSISEVFASLNLPEYSAETLNMAKVADLLSNSLKLSPRALDSDETGVNNCLSQSVPNANEFYSGRSRANTQYNIVRQRGISFSFFGGKGPASSPDQDAMNEKGSRRSILGSKRNSLSERQSVVVNFGNADEMHAIRESNDDLGPSAVPPAWEAKYKQVSVIGQGGFGSVYLIRSKAEPSSLYALKKLVREGSADSSRLETELKALKKASHPNIVFLHDATSTVDGMYLAMDYCSGGCLFDRMLNVELSEPDCSLIVKQILSAIAHLHGIGIVHRDIKLENVLLVSEESNTDIKLSDFGIARILSDAERGLFDGENAEDRIDIRKGRTNKMPRVCITSYVGTVSYMAPEMFSTSPYDQSVDLWATGVLVYMLLSFMSPFGNEENEASLHPSQIKRILTGEYDFTHPVWRQYSPASQLFISRLLVVEPYERYSANEALQHPWIRDLIVKCPQSQESDRSGTTVVPGSRAVGWISH